MCTCTTQKCAKCKYTYLGHFLTIGDSSGLFVQLQTAVGTNVIGY